LWDARPTGISGAKLEKLLEKCSISVNKNSVIGDTSAVSPGGVRLGTPAMTTRGMTEKDMESVAALIDRVTKVAIDVQGKIESKKLVDFLAALEKDAHAQGQLQGIKEDVEKLARSFPLPGIDPKSL
jgi:glycine hydroxymethyltransferase